MQIKCPRCGRQFIVKGDFKQVLCPDCGEKILLINRYSFHFRLHPPQVLSETQLKNIGAEMSKYASTIFKRYGKHRKVSYIG